ncbi:hypothetical protein SRHO_G00323200 [Serrasalmus rhombeus]
MTIRLKARADKDSAKAGNEKRQVVGGCWSLSQRSSEGRIHPGQVASPSQGQTFLCICLFNVRIRLSSAMCMTR